MTPTGSIPPEPAPAGSTPRTRVRRLPAKAVSDRAVLHAILDEGLVAHVAIEADGQPLALPCAYARDGERLLLHGSTGSRLFRTLAAGAPACVTVTLLDGLVYARSLFESSLHYRCAMVLGAARPVRGPAKREALLLLSDRLLPGRLADARHPNKREMAATMVVQMDLAETSVKVSAGPPADLQEDLGLDVWAGTVPLRLVAGEPRDAPDLRAGLPVPSYVRDHSLRGRSSQGPA